MNVKLNPEAERFVESQVKLGHFTSADEVVEAAVDRMMNESSAELDDETAAAINRAEAQLDRGEGIEFEQFAAEWRKKIAAK